jgi:elongator complex protein 3
VRIQRIQRDIPVQRLKGGIMNSNLRQLVAAELHDRGQACHCIRCREIGHQPTTDLTDDTTDDLRLDIQKYQANGGSEYFLSLTTPSRDVLYGYLRLRMIPDPYRPELGPGPCLIVRELRVLGREVPLQGKVKTQTYQHRGLGRRLLAEAERIAKDSNDAHRLFVLSGIGVKPYYRKLGFIDEGFYLAKTLP